MRTLIICATIVLASHCAEAKVDYRNKGISYDEAVERGRRSLNAEPIPVVICKEKRLKSVRQIIREVLKNRRDKQNKHEAPPLKIEMHDTIPIPVDGLAERLKNLA